MVQGLYHICLVEKEHLRKTPFIFSLRHFYLDFFLQFGLFTFGHQIWSNIGHKCLVSSFKFTLDRTLACSHVVWSMLVFLWNQGKLSRHDTRTSSVFFNIVLKQGVAYLWKYFILGREISFNYIFIKFEFENILFNSTFVPRLSSTLLISLENG